jgi:hypothetical protein
MKPTLSPADQQVLEALQQAVNAELERKRRLGHYYVTWRDGEAVMQGSDAPEMAMDDRNREETEADEDQR